MITLHKYWSTIQNRLEEKNCYTPDQFEMWVYNYKYFDKFIELRHRCFNKLHSYPGSDDIVLSYIDIGDCLGCAYQYLKLIIINPFHLLCFPEFTIENIIPHEYCHIMMDEHEGHSKEFFNYFETITGRKHPPMDRTQVMSRAECKYHLEVMKEIR